MKHVSSIIALLLLATALAACSEADQALEFPGGGSCFHASECRTGYICDSFQCRPPLIDPLDQIEIEISPPLSSPYVTTQLLGVNVSAAQSLELELSKPQAYEVLIFDDAVRPPKQLDARISFIGTPRIPGQETDLSTEIRWQNSRTSIVRLLPGMYGVSITRLDGAPSLRTTITVREPISPEVIPREFRFNVRRRLHGHVTSSVSELTKLEGVQVTAFSTSNGLASTTTITDRYGAYAVELPDTEDTSFRLVATLPNAEQPAWGYEEIVVVTGERQKDIPVEPTSPSLKGKARVKFGAATDSGFMPFKDVIVTLTATAAGTTRSFRVKGKTDEEGFLEISDAMGRRDLSVLRGQYTADISPPAESPIARQESFPINLSDVTPLITPEKQIALDLRSEVSGQVVSGLGRPVQFAEVSLTPVDVQALPFRTTTDASGSFLVPVDPGRYVLLIEPTAEADNEIVPIYAQGVEILDPRSQSLGLINMPAASEVYGRVRGEDLSGIANTKIELFQTIMGRAVSIGETFAELDGSFKVILPR